MLTTGEEVDLNRGEMMLVSASPFNAETDFNELNRHFDQRPLDDLLAWTLTTFGSKFALVTSFGPTGMVILDRLAKLPRM
jgi:hypothetical protein